MRKYFHWVFDLDGTVVDSGKFYEFALDIIFREQGLKPTSADIDRAFQIFNPEEYFGHYFKDPDLIKSCVRRLVELNHSYAAQTPAFDGIEDLFIFLKSKNVLVSVWTARELSSATAILESTGLQKYLETCVSRCCVPKTKPHPDGLIKILEEFKHHHEDVIMIGDHHFDMQGAKSANVKGISVDWAGRPHEGAKLNSHWHFEKVEDLHNWAKTLYD
jgi:phosphoglycolate phosphatase-like HAD superfamily hydrolase